MSFLFRQIIVAYFSINAIIWISKVIGEDDFGEDDFGEDLHMSIGMDLEGRVLYLPVHLLHLGQPGRGKATALLQELAASIGEVGILQPLSVRKQGEGYTVVSGNRRLMAARMAGLGEVPCLILSVDAVDAQLIGLTENLQREDLGYFEEAEYLQQYLTRSGLTQAQAAKRLGRSQSAIANKLRLLQHSQKVRHALTEHGLSERHARELLRVYGEDARLSVLQELIQRKLSVAQTVQYIDNYLAQKTLTSSARYRRREARLVLERVVKDAELLRVAGVPAQVQRQESPEEIILTLRIPQNC